MIQVQLSNDRRVDIGRDESWLLTIEHNIFSDLSALRMHGAHILEGVRGARSPGTGLTQAEHLH